tara:strand:+ start:1206 stop:3002 length:1797 start_codon:yes stop_codon:yes gene_type:complete
VCGFVGSISNKVDNFEHNDVNNSYLICRGPDDYKSIDGKFEDYFENYDTNYFKFQFNRLSILDLSSKASQPMISDKYKTILMFNGEIYNHNELRSELQSKDIKFNTSHSDSEVILNGLSTIGISFINRLRGQFAIAFYDSKKRKLTLARDRLGQKPLFYKVSKNNVTFSSNLKSIVTSDDTTKNSSIEDYINYGVVPSPNTIFNNIYKLEPSQIITFDLGDNYSILNKQIFWKIEEYIGDSEFSSDEFFNIFSEAIKIREEADVEVATFLSGGIDSSSIVKNMADRSKEINTYSIGYKDSTYDESKWSNLVAEKYRTNHNLELLDFKYDFEEILKSIDIFDEPYSDPSTYPSYLIAKNISKKYKVAISGDGGDELLGGYSRIRNLTDPNIMKHSLFNILYNMYPGYLGTGNKFLRKGTDIIQAHSSFFSDKKLLNFLGVSDNRTFENSYLIKNQNYYKSLLVTDYKFFLSEMMLLKVDRTSMANSLEVRSPFVDHKLIEYVLSHDTNYYSPKFQKSILKNYLSADLNSDFINRSKQGFVFNLEKFIFENKNIIFNFFSNSKLGIDLKDIKKLSIRSSRINAQRIWKLLFLERYLSSLK